MSHPTTAELHTLTTASDFAPSSRAAIIAGRVLSTLATLFLLFDIAMKLFAPPEAVEGTRALGYEADSLLTLGIIQIICLALYLIPRMAVFGAIL